MKKIEKRTVVCLILTLTCCWGWVCLWCGLPERRELGLLRRQPPPVQQPGPAVRGPGAGPGRGRPLLGGRERGTGSTTPTRRCAWPPSTRWGTPTGPSAPAPLVAFADQLSGYNFSRGGQPLRAGNDLYLTLDARLNYEPTRPWAAGGGGGVYNYETGEILCMVSTPTFDRPTRRTSRRGNEAIRGRVREPLSVQHLHPGSVFKTVTLTAAIETCPTCLGAPSPAPAPPWWGARPHLPLRPRHHGHRRGLRQLLQRGVRPVGRRAGE